MTIGDYPEYLALGFCAIRGCWAPTRRCAAWSTTRIWRRSWCAPTRQTSYEEKLQKKTRTSGCAVGTVFGDMMEGLEAVTLPQVEVRTSDLYALAATINRTPSLYLAAGAIHGTVLCAGTGPLVYMEDVGRHNAVDKIAGWMFSEGCRGG